MYNKKMIAMMLTLSMLAASLAGCAGDEDLEEYDPAADLTADIVTSDWDPILANLNDGEMCDAIISAMTKTDERDQIVDFTVGYYTSSQGVIGGTGVATISDVSELNAAGVTIGVQSGTTSDLYADSDLSMATKTAYADFPSVIAALDNGDVMYAMGDSPVLALEGTLMTTFSDEVFGLAVREDSGELLDALNVAIAAIVDSGEWDNIAMEWDLKAPLTDDSAPDTATAYPTPSDGSTLTKVLNAGSLKFCSDTSYPPFENLDSAGVAVGFDVDIANALVDEIAAHYMGTENPMFEYVAPVVEPDEPDEPAGPTTIKLGFLNDATGPISAFAGAFTYSWGAAVADLNAMGDDYVFEVVEADSGCDGTTAAAAAQTLVDAGVIAVAGAACSGATIGANAVLSAAGIPMLSYASTSPALSNDTNYPHFFRIVPSDSYQSNVMSQMVAADGHTNPAVIHMVNAYGSGLAEAFIGYWSGDICLQAGYDETVQLDFSAQVQAVIDAGCDSVVLASYSADGALIVETMAGMGASLPTYSADGMAGDNSLDDYTAPAAANGLQVTKPGAAPGASTGGAFAAACAATDACSGGIYQNEAYDAVMMLGHAAMHEAGANMSMHIQMTGNAYAGESGTHTFQANGEVPGLYYDVCTYHHVPTYDTYFNCDRGWDDTQGIHTVAWAGATVKIGFLNDASGPISVYADGFRAAYTIGVNLANTIGYSNGVQFEIVEADSGCDGTAGATAAQTLVDAGVWAVVGAACSGASIGANAVLAAAGIPQISYASTSPALENDTNYPGFYRVVPSDAYQGAVMADIVAADGYSNVAVIHMVNAYGSGLADTFVSTIGSANICTQVGYDETTTTDYSSIAQAVIDNGCDSVMMVSYAADGGMIIDELVGNMNFAGQIYGGDGIAEEGLGADMADNSTVAGIIASKPHNPNPMGEVGYVFAALCGANPACAGGIYTAEAFDAVTIAAFAAFTYLANNGTISSELVVAGTGQGWNGASGGINFLANGDIIPAGFCIGEFTVTADAGVNTLSYDCARYWDPVNGVTSAVTV